MSQYKQINKTVKLNSNVRNEPQLIKSELLSFDKKTSQLSIAIDTRDCIYESIDLKKYDAIVTLVYDIDDSSEKGVIFDTAEVYSYDVLHYTLTDKLRFYEGYIDINIALKSKVEQDENEQIDVATFRIKKSNSILDKYSKELIPKFDIIGYDKMIDDAVKSIQEDIKNGVDIPIATKTTTGMIKVGKNLTIEEDGTLNADASNAEFDPSTMSFHIDEKGHLILTYEVNE